jgi:hypothetical protein
MMPSVSMSANISFFSRETISVVVSGTWTMAEGWF